MIGGMEIDVVQWIILFFGTAAAGWVDAVIGGIPVVGTSVTRAVDTSSVAEQVEATLTAAMIDAEGASLPRLRIAAAPEEVQRFAGSPYTEVEPDPDRAGHALFRTSGSDVETIAFHVASFPWDFEVLSPPELRPALAAVAKRLAASAERNRP